MSKARGKIGCDKVNGSADAPAAPRVNSALISVVLALFLSSCSTSQKTLLYERKTTNICSLGEGEVSLKYNGHFERFNISFKRERKKWLFGVETPFKGEQIIKIGGKDNAPNDLDRFLPTHSKGARTLLQMLFPVKNNIRDISDFHTNDGLRVSQSHNFSSKGDFKVMLIKDIFFIKRTYAQLDFRVTYCGKMEKFQVIKN